ncbi:KH domain-containing protein [Apilactobacillus bombintestini]|uniref:RNA-binding protein KhpA n=1 Tax=Apilactobacillus bombintestini TaxID=2419772 RepID=A0A387APJ1_9LACO|nr:KH domain-containing protein [Apilactobacillus bombintestini]AYF92632.1 KH domain-containing protein [Apilactobacillus bombintestini]
MTNFDELIKKIVKPLVEYPEDVIINHGESDRFYEYYLSTNPSDVGRIIGKKGHVAQTIRTIVYSARISGEKRVRLIIDDGKSKNS